MTDETNADARDAIETVVKRAAFLDRLASGPTGKRDLRDDLGVSRSTVYKAMRELEEANLAEETDKGCRLTLYGRLLVEEYGAFAQTVGDVSQYERLLSVLPPESPVTTGALVGADRVSAERHAPNRPVGRIEQVVRNTDRVVGFSPVVLAQYVDLFHDQVVSGGLTAELVLERPVVEYMQEDHGELFAEALDTGRLTVWVTDESLPFGLVVGEGAPDEVVVIAYDRGGELRGVIVNDTAAALDWSDEVFRAYRSRAEQFDPT